MRDEEERGVLSEWGERTFLKDHRVVLIMGMIC